MEHKGLICFLSSDASKTIGTGFFVSPDGLIISCLHVLVEGNYLLNIGQTVNIYREDLKQKGIAEIISISSNEEDIVLLRADPSKFYYDIIFEKQEPIDVFCPGYPADTEFIVASAHVTLWDEHQVQLDNANSIGPGYSGSPILYNQHVIGMIKSISKCAMSRYTQLAFGISSDVLNKIICSLSPLSNDSSIPSRIETEPSIEKEYLLNIINGNDLAYPRDLMPYLPKNAPKSWIDLYSFPVLSVGRNPVTSLLCQYDHVLIVSDSGLGKSQLIQGLTWLYANFEYPDSEARDSNRFKELCSLFGIQDPLVPILFRGKDFTGCADSKKLLEKAVLSVEDGGSISDKERNELEKIINDNKAILLIDSFDEIKQEGDKRALIQMLKDFKNNYSEIPVVITSRRANGIQEICHLGFEEVVLHSFDDDQIREQIKKRIPDEKNAETTTLKIQENEYLKSMARSPIMLSTITLSVVKDGTFKSVQEYLSELTAIIIEQRWQSMGELITLSSVQSILSGLAWLLIKNNQPSFAQQDITFVLDETISKLSALKDPVQWQDRSRKRHIRIRKLSDELSVRSGILVLDTDRSHFVFQDTLIECYLASLHIKALLNCYSSKKDISEFIVIDTIHQELKDVLINTQIMNSLALAFPLLLPHLQKALLEYIVIRGVTSTERNEIQIIIQGLKDLLNNSFGPNVVVNKPNIQPTKEWTYTTRYLHQFQSHGIP